MRVYLIVGGKFLFAGNTASLITVEPHRLALGYVALEANGVQFQAPHWHLRALDDEAGAVLMRARIQEEMLEDRK